MKPGPHQLDLRQTDDPFRPSPRHQRLLLFQNLLRLIPPLLLRAWMVMVIRFPHHMVLLDMVALLVDMALLEGMVDMAFLGMILDMVALLDMVVLMSPHLRQRQQYPI